MVLPREIVVDKYLFIAIIYFFVNSLALPHGLLFTTILTPLFLVWLFRNGYFKFSLYFIFALIPFAIAHIYYGVDFKSYVISTGLIYSAFVFLFTCLVFVNSSDKINNILWGILYVNFCLVLLSLILLFTPFDSLVWTYGKENSMLENFPRLSLFTYEPSYYGTLLIPLIGFFVSMLLKEENARNRLIIFSLIFIPFILTFSLGIWTSVILGASFTLLLNIGVLRGRKNVFISLLGVGLGTLLFIGILYFVYPENALFQRVKHIISGNDPSAQGRLINSYWLAYQLAKMKSIIWGAGQGQIKILAIDFLSNLYQTKGEVFPVMRIPNAMAETLGYFGIVGICVRLFLIVWLFFKTKVYNNYFRSFLFFTIFIYQFTGSYITNVAEYVVWALAFTGSFTQFNREPLNFPTKIKK